MSAKNKDREHEKETLLEGAEEARTDQVTQDNEETSTLPEAPT